MLKRLKKSILDELGQNWAFIANQMRNWDQRLKLGEDDENTMENPILEEKKQEGRVLNTQENFHKLANWISREYLELIAIL